MVPFIWPDTNTLPNINNKAQKKHAFMEELGIKLYLYAKLLKFMRLYFLFPFALPYLSIALIILWQLFYVSKYCIYGTIIYDCNFPKWAINFKHNQSIEFEYFIKLD